MRSGKQQSGEDFYEQLDGKHKAHVQDSARSFADDHVGSTNGDPDA